MVNVLEMAQKVLVLADALYAVTKSENLVNANESIRRSTKITDRSNGGISLARDLMSCRHDIEISAKSLLMYSDWELQQMAVYYKNEDVQKQINKEVFTKNEARVLAETKEYSIDVKDDFIRMHGLAGKRGAGRTLDLAELSCDEQATEALDGLSAMIANLNTMYGLAEQINTIIEEINCVKAGNDFYLDLLKYVQEIMCARTRTYRYMCDRLKKTSKYSFCDVVIWSFCETGYKGKDLMELLDFDICAKPCLTFGEMPSYILFNRLDGSTCVFLT